ncbi:spore coat U domain-containing protein [Salinicola halophilus]|uniref:Csu type fimbrial protein n=1 Tax=Salinicola halophilus TaxID=184065 RepID=UPI0013A63A61|nr:spore coat U domain-containing protein [Salinicola halophilus]
MAFMTPGAARVALVTLATALMAPGALAQTPQQSFQVAARVTEGCLIGAAAGGAAPLGRLDFGTASALSEATLTSAVVQTGGVSLECTPGLALTMRVGGGLNPSGGARYLTHEGGGRLAYALFADAGLGRRLDIDQPMSFVLGTGVSRVTLPLYGRLTLPESAAAGTYTDRLTVTLEW